MKTSHTMKDLLDMVRVGDRFRSGDDENARIYKFIERPGRSEDGEPALVLECSTFGAFPDIYEGLEMFALGTDSRAVAIALTTQGWAVPFTRDEEGNKVATVDVPPSEHPDRRRVALLFLLTDDNEQASRLVMVDTGEVLEESDGGNEAHGQLLDACGMALTFHRADKEHLRALIESTRDRLADGMTIEDFGFGDDLPAD